MRTKRDNSFGGGSPARGKSLVLILVASTALFVVAAQAGPQGAKPAAGPDNSKGDVEKGKQLYTSSGCYECHGRQGQGSRYSGARIAPDPPSLPAFVEYIRAPKGQMPPYTSKVLTDLELADIHAFLESLPKPPPAKTIPLLN